ncbi:hypothetical protein IJ182_06200 [bacterium]|nr:hypothetical protein [bacterium]
MQISKITLPVLTGITKPSVKQNSIPSFGLKEDTFQRSAEIQRNGEKSFENFSRWQQRNAYASRPQLKGPLLGAGDEAKVYAIDGTDNWVIKQYNRSEMIPLSIERPVLNELTDIAPDINIGQAIAKLDVPLNKHMAAHHFILKKQEGHPIGIPVERANSNSQSDELAHLRTLRELSKAPQASYDRLIDDITYIDEQGLKIKAGNPSNILFDSKHQQFNFIDVNDAKKDESNQYGEVLYALLDGKYAQHFKAVKQQEAVQAMPIFRPYAEYFEADSNSNKIIEKYFASMQTKGKKFTQGKYFNRLLASDSLDKVLGSKTVQGKLESLQKMDLV